MNYYNRNSNYNSRPPMGRPQLYDIHPTSIKLIQKGNPWVTLDKFSEQFHPNDKFIVAANRRRPFALLLHDPRHQNVRGRLWSKEGNFGKQIKNFKNDFIKRVQEAFKQRRDQKILQRRNNLYLLFGEADRVPGLFIQLLDDQVLIQSYTYFWDRYEDMVVNTVLNQLSSVFNLELTKSDLWMQNRSAGSETKTPAKSFDPNLSFKHLEIEEFGCKYEISLGKFYDTGIYTDMSSIRNKMSPLYKESESVLNLFSYTGAFSLHALKSGAKEVVSVDLSQAYIDMLEKNLSLNEDLKEKKHESMVMSSVDAMDKLIKEGKTFDVIINDPPSSSSDGNKKTNALKEYEKMLPMMDKLLSEKGKMVVFLNTHSTPKRRFNEKLEKIIDQKKLKLVIKKFLSLHGDCPSMPRFPQGSYLKGFVIERATEEEVKKAKEKSQNAQKKKESQAKPRPKSKPQAKAKKQDDQGSKS